MILPCSTSEISFWTNPAQIHDFIEGNAVGIAIHTLPDRGKCIRRRSNSCLHGRTSVAIRAGKKLHDGLKENYLCRFHDARETKSRKALVNGTRRRSRNSQSRTVSPFFTAVRSWASLRSSTFWEMKLLANDRVVLKETPNCSKSTFSNVEKE